MSSIATTHIFKETEDGLSLTFDFYPPATQSNPLDRIPVVVYFHGGALILERVNAMGYAFISANYRLILPTASVHHIAEDVKDLLMFLTENPNVKHTEASGCEASYTLDPSRFAASGSSGGAWAAYLAAACWPNLKALVTIYGQGGDLLTPAYIQPKTEPFFFGQPLWDVNSSEIKKYLYPLAPGAIEPSGGHPTLLVPNNPLTGREVLFTLYRQTGTVLDYYTAQHEPSLSTSLQSVLANAGWLDNASTKQHLEDAIPTEHRLIFPQILATQVETYPPTLTIHGQADSIISVQESRYIGSALRKKGVEVVAIEVEGPDGEHAFDLMPGAEAKFGGQFDKVAAFVKDRL